MSSVEGRTRVLPSLIRLIYYGIDFTLGCWLRIYPEMTRGNLVMCDRYFYDYFVASEPKRVTAPRWVLRTFCAFYPRPQRVFVLTADPERVRARRADLTIAEIERQNEALRAVAQIYPELELIDSNLDINATAERIIHRMAKNMPKNFTLRSENE
jgi:thymidylate kinase